MKLIICIDNAFGYSFNGRRQSRDSGVVEDIIETTKDGTLWMSPYSKALFEDKGSVIACDDFLDKAGDDYAFVEKDDINGYLDKASEIVLYRWNRDYPADRYLNVDLSKWEKTGDEILEGYSHKNIEKEIFKK